MQSADDAAMLAKFRNIEIPKNDDVRATVRLPGRTVRLRHAIGDTVYHRLADERRPGLVTGYIVRPGGCLYYVTWRSRHESGHYEMELADEYAPDFGTGNQTQGNAS